MAEIVSQGGSRLKPKPALTLVQARIPIGSPLTLVQACIPISSPSLDRRPWTLFGCPSPVCRATAKEGIGEEKEERRGGGVATSGSRHWAGRRWEIHPAAGGGQGGGGREEGRRLALLDCRSRNGSRLVWAWQRAYQLAGPKPRALGPTGAGKAYGRLWAAFPGQPCHL